MNTYPSTACLDRSSLMVAIVVLFSTAILLTIILIESSAAQRPIPSEKAAGFIGYIGTVCGRVTSVDQNSKAINALLLFGNPKSPSFTASIFPQRRDLERKYEGKQVCVMGRIVDQSEPDGFPTIRVTDESQISIQ